MPFVKGFRVFSKRPMCNSLKIYIKKSCEFKTFLHEFIFRAQSPGHLNFYLLSNHYSNTCFLLNPLCSLKPSLILSFSLISFAHSSSSHSFATHACNQARHKHTRMHEASLPQSMLRRPGRVRVHQARPQPPLFSAAPAALV